MTWMHDVKINKLLAFMLMVGMAYGLWLSTILTIDYADIFH
jgi:hypothetical protein